MADPIIWSDVDLFLSLLERTGDVHVRLYPRKEKERKEGSSGTALSFTLLVKEGRSVTKTSAGVIREIEAILRKPEYQEHSLGVVINPGGTEAKEIEEGRAIWFEADGGLPLDDQLALPVRIGLPPPTISIWSGSRSVHHYWVGHPPVIGAASKGLPPAQWKQAQTRLIAAVKKVSPEAGVDEKLKDLPRVMRAPGGIHPATGERTSFLSECGELFDLAALVEMLPALPETKKAPSVARAEGSKDEEVAKARKALAFLPPLEFTSYGDWLGVGMALHSGSADLLADWIEWSQGMGDAFDEEECCAKWNSFSIDRDESITLGSLIHWAKEYGYRPPASADTSSRYTAGLSSLSSLSSLEQKSVRGVRGLSLDERMDLLREKATDLLKEDAALLNRLPAMREKASELDLQTRDGDLSKILWEARRRLATPVEALGEGDLLDFTPIPWCWEGLIMREATNLVIAAPKVGKTSLILEAIGSWSRGEAFLGRAFHGKCPPVLIVGTDQPQSDWGRMLQKVGLVSQERRILAPLVGLFHSGTPLQLDPEGIEKITAYAKNHPGLLVLVDSYSRCISSLGLSERDAEMVGPLADLQEAVAPYGVTIVVIHHSNKGAHDSGSMASRGSTALPAAVSQILHLQRLEASQEQQSAAGKRMLTTEGRGGAPEKFLLELDQEGQWIFKGDGDALLREQDRQKLIGALNDRQAAALEHVEETWEQTEGRQGLSADCLASLMELRGADTSRVARRLLTQLHERGLVRKVMENHGMGRALVARYVPSSPPSADSQDSADSPAVKREEVSSLAEPPSMDSVDEHPPHTPPEMFDSVEVFQGGRWENGWWVIEEGEELELVRSDDPEKTLRLDWSLVRRCAA